MADEKRKPAKNFGPVWTGSGYIQVAVWASPGENRVKYSVTFKRSYNAAGTWKETQSLFDGDLLALARLLERAWEWIAAQHGEQERPPSPALS